MGDFYGFICIVFYVLLTLMIAVLPLFSKGRKLLLKYHSAFMLDEQWLEELEDGLPEDEITEAVMSYLLFQLFSFFLIVLWAMLWPSVVLFSIMYFIFKRNL